MRKLLILVILGLSVLPFAVAEHYIVGHVNDAIDGTPANGKTIRMWNYLTMDEINSTIGPSGPSGVTNVYMINCEMFETPCMPGDIISLEVLNDGDNYLGISTVNVTVTGFGSDLADNITLNSPPSATNFFPLENSNISGTVNINCSASDFDSNLKTNYLYLNHTGWHLNDSADISGGDNYTIFSKDLPDGNYKYSCSAIDEKGIESVNDYNTSFTLDSTPPLVSLIEYNESYICGTTGKVRVSCTTTDGLTGIHNVLIGNGQVNYSTSLLSADIYYADILIDELGNTSFECYAEDYAGNIGKLEGEKLSVFSANPDFLVSSIFIPNNSMEGVDVIINATIENIGCADSAGVQIGLFTGDPDSNGISVYNQTNSITGLSSKNVSLVWTSEIGTTNLFIKADSNESFSEVNESNNKLNKTTFVTAWQELYGNISTSILIGVGDENINLWGEVVGIEGNIFIIDKESQIDWLSLQAIGRKSNGDISSSDFSEIDSILGMNSLNDSVSKTFNVVSTRSFNVHNRVIPNVTVVNSTINSVFTTGILWDMSDDSNGEFDDTEKEDIIFISEINKSTLGRYGVYDYEIKIPAKLRETNNADTTELYFYYDLN